MQASKENEIYRSRQEIQISKDVNLAEGNFKVRNLKTAEDFKKAFKLRHQIFANELKWVASSDDGLEIDEYDLNAESFGVFNHNEQLCAYMRLIIGGTPFMMEKEFKFLVDEKHWIRNFPDTAEVSRLCIAPESRNDTVTGNFGLHSITILLLKGVYQWCKKNGVNYLYAVTEERVYRLFRAKGFPFYSIGEPRKMPDGVVAAALMMDWSDFVEKNKTKRPRMLGWFNQAGLSQHLWQ